MNRYSFMCLRKKSHKGLLVGAYNVIVEILRHCIMACLFHGEKISDKPNLKHIKQASRPFDPFSTITGFGQNPGFSEPQQEGSSRMCRCSVLSHLVHHLQRLQASQETSVPTTHLQRVYFPKTWDYHV